MRRLVWVALWGVFVGWAARGYAEPVPRVAVVVNVVSGDRRVEDELARALKTQHELPVELRLSELPNRPSEAVESVDAELTRALADARKAYVSADFEACLAALPDETRLTDLLAHDDRLGAARALLWRVACEVGRGRDREAQRVAAELARLGLSLPPDIEAIAPDAERVLTDALQEAQASPRASLRVESVPEGREVWLDGRALGCVTPCVTEAIVGDHVIALRGDGTKPAALRLRVEPQGTQHVLPLEPAPPELARRQWSARYGAARELDSVPSLSLLAQAVPAQKLVLIEVAKLRAGKLELRGAYAIDGALASRASSEPMVQDELPDAGLALVRELLVRGKTLEPAKPLWRNGWFWGAIGVVAAGAATATALLLQKPDQRTEVRF